MASSKASSGLVVLPSGLVQSESVTLRALRLPPSPSCSNPPVHFLGAFSKAGDLLRVVELNKHVSPYGSVLLVGDDVTSHVEAISNGNVTFVTAVDPLFVMLASPIAARRDVFQPLTEYVRISLDLNLTHVLPGDNLTVICDTKHALGETYFRLSEEKVLLWLKKKYEKISTVVKDRNHAVELLTYCVTSEWADKLRAELKDELKEARKEKNTNSNDPCASAEQTDGEAANLAMSVMFSEAQQNIDNEQQMYNSAQQQQNSNANATSVASKQKTRKQPTRKAIVSSDVSAKAKKFWATQATNKAKEKSAKSKTKETAGSTASGKASATAKRKRSGK